MASRGLLLEGNTGAGWGEWVWHSRGLLLEGNTGAGWGEWEWHSRGLEGNLGEWVWHSRGLIGGEHRCWVGRVGVAF